MYRNFKIVKVSSKYCDYLRKYDNKVPYNAGSKDKHKRMRNTLYLIKIKDGEYGVINFNNMIPVSSNNYEEFDLNKRVIIRKKCIGYNLLIINYDG